MAYVELPPQELWLTYIKNVHVVSARLEQSVFRHALAVVLGQYPIIRGRLQPGDSNWRVELTENQPIIVNVEELITSDFTSLAVSQDNLSAFLPHTGPADPLQNPLCPLLQFKLTMAETTTLIGVCWHHVLGDATSLLYFMRSLSQVYQGQHVTYVPSFDKHAFPPPDIHMIETFAPKMPHLTNSCSPPELWKRYAERCPTLKSFDWTISRRQAERIRQRACAFSSLPLSIQDCLTSWVLSILLHCGERITKVTNAASYRHVGTAFRQANTCGNLIYVVPTAEIYPEDSYIAIAEKIRTSLIEARKESLIEIYVSVSGQYMLKAANAGEQFFWGAEDGVLSVNSNLTLDWQAVNFGHQSQARFFTTAATSKYYLRVFKANVLLDDDETIYLSLGLPEEILMAFSERLHILRTARVVGFFTPRLRTAAFNNCSAPWTGFHPSDRLLVDVATAFDPMSSGRSYHVAVSNTEREESGRTYGKREHLVHLLLSVRPMFRVFLARQESSCGERHLFELNSPIRCEVVSLCAVRDALPLWREKLLDEEHEEVDTLGLVVSEMSISLQSALSYRPRS